MGVSVMFDVSILLCWIAQMFRLRKIGGLQLSVAKKEKYPQIGMIAFLSILR